MRIKFVWRLIAVLVLVSLAPLAAVVYSLGGAMQRSLERSARAELSLQAENVAAQIESYMHEHLQVMKTMANLPDIQSMDGARQVPVLVATAAQEVEKSNGFVVLGPDGVAVARSDGKPLKDLSEREYFQKTITGADHYYQTVIGATDGQPTLIAAVPVRRDNKVVGVLFSNQNLDLVMPMVNDISIGETGFVWLTDTADTYMAHRDKNLVAEQVSAGEHEAVIAARAGNLEPQTLTEDGKRLLTVSRVTPQGWVLVVQIDEAEVLAPVQEALRSQITVIVALVLAVILISVLFSQSISRRIKQMARAVTAMAGGDFTTPIQVKGTDEIGEMAAGLLQMQSSLGEHIRSVQSAAGGVATSANGLTSAAGVASQSQRAIAATFDETVREVEAVTRQQQERLGSTKQVVGELVAAVEQIANSATHQATEVSEASQVVEQVIQQAEHVSSGILRVSDAVAKVDGASSLGQSTVEEALASIRLTKEQVDGAAVTVRELGSRSEAIGSILEEITAIADQTNLLALNAAIEAARAGEAGRGFAVVAEEVRRLADRSVRSTEEIAQILAAVREGVVQVATAMEQGASAAADGAGRANEAQAALDSIRGAVLASTQESALIKQASEALLEGHRRLGQAVQTLAAVTEENSAAAEEMAAGSETVKATVQDLDALALQSLTTIRSTSGDIAALAQAINQVVEMASGLERVSNALANGVSRFRS